MAIASLEDSVADYVAACRATGQKPFLDDRHFGLPLGRVPGMIDWIKTVQGIAAIVALIFATFAVGGAEEQEGGEPPRLPAPVL